MATIAQQAQLVDEFISISHLHNQLHGLVSREEAEEVTMIMAGTMVDLADALGMEVADALEFTTRLMRARRHQGR